MLIHGYVPKETPPAVYYKLMNSVVQLHASLSRGGGDTAEYQRLFLQLQDAVTMPEPIDAYGSH